MRQRRGYRFGERLAVKLAGYIPPPVLAAPERVLINMAAVLIGMSALAPEPGALIGTWPTWLAVEWAAWIGSGGLISLIGQWNLHRRMERWGAILYGSAAFFYATNLFVVFGVRAVISGVIFYGIACAKAVRVIRNGAITATIRQHQTDDR